MRRRGWLNAHSFDVLGKRKRFKEPCHGRARPAVFGYGALSYLGQSHGSNAGHLLRARIRPLPPRRHGYYHNAAPEWQAGSLGWRSRKWMKGCSLEGLVSKQL